MTKKRGLVYSFSHILFNAVMDIPGHLLKEDAKYPNLSDSKARKIVLLKLEAYYFYFEEGHKLKRMTSEAHRIGGII